MFGRIDDTKFQSGAAKLRNFIALPQGPAVNRPGTKFVNEAKYQQKVSHFAVRSCRSETTNLTYRQKLTAAVTELPVN